MKSPLPPPSVLRVTLVVLWCVMGSSMVSSPGVRAVLSLTARAFTPKSAPCCLGLKIFSPYTAKLSSSIAELHGREETSERLKLKVTETRGGDVINKTVGQ